MSRNITPAIMREYLRYAVIFEKNCYIWSRAMEQANRRMNEIYTERKVLENAFTNAQNSLAALEGNPQITLDNTKKNVADKKLRNVGIILLFIPGLFIIGLICLAVYNSEKKKKPKQDVQSEENSKRRKKLLLEDQEHRAANDLVVNAVEEDVLSKRQEDIAQALREAEKNRERLYAENILPTKYRYFSCVATLYEYLATGRCNTIYGHGGIYDTFETERLAIEQLEQLVRMNRTLDTIEFNQRFMMREIQKANSTLSAINNSLKEIEKTNAEIATNTAISAEMNKQTAASAQYMADRMRWGY